jgi:hypothetical protein
MKRNRERERKRLLYEKFSHILPETKKSMVCPLQARGPEKLVVLLQAEYRALKAWMAMV